MSSFHIKLFTAFLLACAPTWAQAQRVDRDATKSSAVFKATFKPVIEEARKSTAVVTSNGTQIAMATVVDKNGLLLTKASEVAAAKTLSVRVWDKDFSATIVGVSAPHDLALLKIDSKDLIPAAFIDDKKLVVGQWVVSVGPSDLPLSVGVVSVGRRKIGGQSAFLGVGLADTEEKDGAKITQVMPKSAAEKAGVHVDDLITKVGDKSIASRAELVTAIREFHPGDVVPLTIRRTEKTGEKSEEKTLDLKATLGTIDGAGPPVFNFQQSLLGGPVSKRSSDFPTVFQHDTILRPIDCGGPLVDLDGKVVGLNIARAGRTETYAIPTDVLLPLIKELASGKLAVKISTTSPATNPATQPSTQPSTKPKG